MSYNRKDATIKHLVEEQAPKDSSFDKFFVDNIAKVPDRVYKLIKSEDLSRDEVASNQGSFKIPPSLTPSSLFIS